MSAAAGPGLPPPPPPQAPTPFLDALGALREQLRQAFEAAERLEAQAAQRDVCEPEGGTGPSFLLARVDTPSETSASSGATSPGGRAEGPLTGRPVEPCAGDKGLLCPDAPEPRRLPHMLAAPVLRPIWDELTAEELQQSVGHFRAEVQLQPGGTDMRLKRAQRKQTNLASSSSSPGEFRCMLDPNRPLRLVWSLPAVGFVAYDTIMVPLQAFHEFIDDSRAIQAIELLIAIFWTIDIAVSFRTGFFQGTSLEMRPHRVAQEYARTWFVPDVVLVLLEWVGQLVGTMSNVSLARVTRVLRVVRCARLVRLVKLPNVWRLIEDQINSNLLHLVFDIFKAVLAFLVCVHAVTCAWFAIGVGDSTGWITYDVAAQQDGSFTFWYFASSRWVLAQINGRTDMNERRNMKERLFTCVVATLLAVVFMSIFVSSITATVLKLSEISAKSNRLRRSVNEYLLNHRVSVALVAGVKRQMLANASIKALLDDQERETEVLALLPEHLQYDLLYEIRAPFLAWHGFFREVDIGFSRVVRHLCLTAMRPVLAHNNETVFEHGDPCCRMLFVDKGRLNYRQRVRRSDFCPSVRAREASTWDPCSAEGPKGDQIVPRPSTRLEPRSRSSWKTVRRESGGQLGSTVLGRDSVHSLLSGALRAQRTYARAEPTEEEEGLEWKIRRGMWLSEGALWIDWENQGRLFADMDCTLMALHAQDMGRTLLAYRDAYAMCVVYARSFLEALKVQGQPSDLTKISFFFDTTDRAQ